MAATTDSASRAGEPRCANEFSRAGEINRANELSRAENPSVVFTARDRVEVQHQPVTLPGPGEVLVRTRRSLISTGTELTLLHGTGQGEAWSGLTHYPRTSGYSNVGDVVAVGDGVDPAWLGQRVHNHGPHQAYACSPADRIAALPPEVADESATFTTLAKVAMNGLRRAGLTWGESVVVVGLGLVGQLACQLCRVAGAQLVVAVDPSDFRRGCLPAERYLVPWSGSLEALATHLPELNHGRLADLVIEATGDSAVLPQEPALLRPHGRLLILSSPRGASRFDFHDLCNRRSLTLLGAHGFSHPPVETPDSPWTSRRHGEIFLDLIAGGQVNTKPLISHRFPAQEAPEAYRLLGEHRGEALGVVLEW